MGPTWSFPTSTNDALGSEKWEVGPASVLVWKNEKVTAALFISPIQEAEVRRDLLYLQRDVSRLLKTGEGAGVLTPAQTTTLSDARETSAVPVSTTHVVTSGVVGSMRASGAGLQLSTTRGILITRFTTMPGCFALSFALSIVLHAAFA